MDDILGIQRLVLQQLLTTLKTLDVRGYESMNRLVGCVMLLEQLLSAPKEQEKTEEVPLEEVADG